MLTFFEKLKAKEKKDPGTLEKIFSSHPTTGKRVEKARKLLVRFPGRDEYMVSTSEFSEIKDKLQAITSAQNIGGDDGVPTLKRKPTLKRGDEGSGGGEKDDGVPTLKRKPGSDN
jgi:predicted Zn-dependent protease